MIAARSLLALLLVRFASAPVAAPPVVNIGMRDFAFDAPASIAAGPTTFKATNLGKNPHHAILIKLGNGKTAADLLAALSKPGAPPAWATLMGGPQENTAVTIDMTPGNYIWICMIPLADGTPHLMKGMMKAFTVRANKSPARVPVADINVTMQDYTWTFSKPLSVGSHVLKVAVAPGQPHELVIWKLHAGKVLSDLAAWGAKLDGPPPADIVGGVSPMQAGMSNVEGVKLTPGNYVLMCFLPDAKDGQEHFKHGMVQELTLK